MRKASVADSPGAERLARALQVAPLQLDEMARARTERNLVEAWRVRGAHAVPLHKNRSGMSRTVWMGSLAVSSAFGVVLGLFLLRAPADQPAPGPENVAHFDLVIGEGAVQSGIVVAGQVLESGKHGHIEVGLAQTRLDIAPDSRVRFERIDGDEVRLALVQGRVDVAFHPLRKGEQQLSVETAAARVVVVGTRFAVEADASRSTRVSVTEGTVRVEPRRGTGTLLVHAGEQVTVPAEPAHNLPRVGAIGATVLALEHGDAQQGGAALMLGGKVTPADEPLADIGHGAELDDAAGSLSSRRATLKARRAQRSHSGDRTHRQGNASRAEQRLESARRMLLAGKHGEAREKLERMGSRSTLPADTRVEALMLMAESFTAQGQVPRAAASYRRAVEVAPRQTAGHNALFALARLLDRYTHDNVSAAAAYREYLAKAPHGALASQAEHALCRLSANSANCRGSD